MIAQLLLAANAGLGIQSFLGSSVEVPMGVLMALFLLITLPTAEVSSIAQSLAGRFKADASASTPASTPAPAPTDAPSEVEKQG